MVIYVTNYSHSRVKFWKGFTKKITKFCEYYELSKVP